MIRGAASRHTARSPGLTRATRADRSAARRMAPRSTSATRSGRASSSARTSLAATSTARAVASRTASSRMRLGDLVEAGHHLGDRGHRGGGALGGLGHAGREALVAPRAAGRLGLRLGRRRACASASCTGGVEHALGGVGLGPARRRARSQRHLDRRSGELRAPQQRATQTSWSSPPRTITIWPASSRRRMTATIFCWASSTVLHPDGPHELEVLLDDRGGALAHVGEDLAPGPRRWCP